MTLHALAASLAVPAAGEDIRDIRAPIAIPEWWRWPLAIALSALAALAVILVVRWWRKRNARPLTPHERALAALRVAETLAREGRSHEWADVVAETLRASLSARLGGEVLPKTTSELAQTPALHAGAPRLIELLQVCDLARFAMGHLASPALLQWTVFAREAVDHLFAPVAPPAAAPAAASLSSQPVTTT